MLDYLDFRYVHRPPNHENNPLRKCQSKTIANDNFYLKKEECFLVLKFSDLILILHL